MQERTHGLFIPLPLVEFSVHLGTEDSQEATKPQLYQAGNWEPAHQGPIFNLAPSQLCVWKNHVLLGLQNS